MTAAILHRHLRRLAYAIGEVPHDARDRPQQMRAAYIAHTRTLTGGFTEAHLLLVRDRHLLPADLLTNIEALRYDLGDILAYGHADLVLDLLDSRAIDAPRLEAFLATLPRPQTEPAEPPLPEAAAPIPPAPPRIPSAAQQALASSWAELLEAFTPPPPNPTDDLYRVGRGFRAHPPP